MNIEQEKAVQGNADGLCGLYALANFLIVSGEIVAGYPEYGTKIRHEAVRYIWEATERVGLLSASKLYSGYEWPDLIAIFNSYARYNHFAFVALPLKPLRDHIVRRSSRGLLASVVDTGGAAIVPVAGNRHWVLVYGRSEAGAFKVVDPTLADPQTELLRSPSANDGLALLPTNSELAQIK